MRSGPAPFPHCRGSSELPNRFRSQYRAMGSGEKRKHSKSKSRKEKQSKRKKRKKERRSRNRSRNPSSSHSDGGGCAPPASPPSPQHLLLAAAVGDRARCRQLIEQGADVAYADGEGTTALHEVRGVWAAQHAAPLPVRRQLRPERGCLASRGRRPAGTATCRLLVCCCGGEQTRGWRM